MTTADILKEISSSSHVVKIYPFDGEFIASFNYKDDNPSTSTLETVIILDRSGSMGNSVQKIVQKVLPEFFYNLQYDRKTVISLIAFECQTTLHKIMIGDLNRNTMRCAGGTNMAGAVENLERLFKVFKTKSVNFLRILTISDGEIFDGIETKKLGDKLAEYAARCNISVNSQAVRLFTSYSQPDTTALCTLLRLNNVEKSNLLDIASDKSHYEIANEMSSLFINDGFANAQFLTSSKAIFQKLPWNDEIMTGISVLQGKNVFWLKEIPTEPLEVNETPVKVIVESSLTINELHSLLDTKIDFVIDRIKVLKVVNTEYAKKTIEKIVAYFKKIEKSLEMLEVGDANELKSFANRTQILKINLLRSKKFSQFLSAMANDESIDKLNAEQKAAYLRNVQGTSQAGRGLAMRAAKKAQKALNDGEVVLSVDETLRKEVIFFKEAFEPKLHGARCGF